ncbi:MAG: alpha-L-rhamnosidase N-terminal domain-containing protein [Methylosarcina sp.]
MPYKDRLYKAEWGTADWITPRKATASGYYRTKLMIDSLATKAILQVAAPDHFEIYVNGKKVGANSFTSIFTTGIYDITSLLEMGPNVIAIRVVKKTYTGPASLIVNGYWQSSISNKRHKIVTDTESWRVSTKQESQAGGEVSWYDEQFIDDQWDKPIPYALEDGEIIQDLTVPPDIYAEFPKGQWIWSHDTSALNGTFRRTFDLDGNQIESAWLGIATNGTYKLAVNDNLLLTGSPGNSNMDTLNIGRYLKLGHNNITVEITSHQPGIRLAVSALVSVDGKRIELSSDQNWLAKSTIPHNIESEDNWYKAFLLGPMELVPISYQLKVKSGVLRGLPALRIMTLEVPLTLAFEEIFSFFWPVSITLLANIYLGMIFVSFFEKWIAIDKFSALEIYALPNFVGILLIAFALLISFDMRVDPSVVLSGTTFWGICLIILSWIAWLMLEAYLKHTKFEMPSRWPGRR